MERSSLCSLAHEHLESHHYNEPIPIGNHLANELHSSFVQPIYMERAALSSDARYYLHSLIRIREKKCRKRREIFPGKQCSLKAENKSRCSHQVRLRSILAIRVSKISGKASERLSLSVYRGGYLLKYSYSKR